MNFKTKLEKIQKKNNSLVCVGLDTDLEKIPKFINKKLTDDAADALGIALCYIIKANRKIKLS